jgi:selenocysteine lyase/cysteine desulfurase
MNFNETFPILKKYTYLNTANSGLLSASIANWRQEHDSEFVQGGSMFRVKNLEVMEQLRITLSNTFFAKKKNTFLMSNFSSGFNTILDGIGKNHRFLLLKEDYPTMQYAITSRNFDFFEVPIDSYLEHNIINSIEKFKPTVFAFSMVQYTNGLRMQGDFIKQLKVMFPDLILIADGTQFLGTGVFNFEQSGLDMLIGSGYKWLLGGYGNGYVFLSDALKEILYENRKLLVLPTAKFLSGRDYLSLSLEPGHLDSLNFGTLNQGINYLKTVGLEFIEKNNQEIAAKARTALQAKGLIEDWIIERKEQSSIISVPLEKETLGKLEAEKVVCSVRGAGTRISFHFYNTEKDLNRFLEVLG